MNERSFLLLARASDPMVETLQRLLPECLVHAGIADLTRAGWRYVVGDPQHATACAGGRVLAASEIGGVVCRIGAVTPHDVQHLHPDDRAFAAAEINAFLRAWLTQFEGRLCNEPSPESLAGPAWHPMRWRWIATQLQIPVVTKWQDAARPADATTVLVAGDHVVGGVDSTLVRHSLRIAEAARSRLLAVRFAWEGRWLFDSADSSPQPGSAASMQLLNWALGPQERPPSSPAIEGLLR